MAFENHCLRPPARRRRLPAGPAVFEAESPRSQRRLPPWCRRRALGDQQMVQFRADIEQLSDGKQSLSPEPVLVEQLRTCSWPASSSPPPARRLRAARQAIPPLRGDPGGSQFWRDNLELVSRARCCAPRRDQARLQRYRSARSRRTHVKAVTARFAVVSGHRCAPADETRSAPGARPTPPRPARAPSQIRHLPPVQRVGTVTGVAGLIIESDGPNVGLGDLCLVRSPKEDFSVRAEVVGFREHRVLLMPLGDMAGLRVGGEVVACARPALPIPGPAMLGRVLDAFGRPFDGLGAALSACPPVVRPAASARRQRIRCRFRLAPSTPCSVRARQRLGLLPAPASPVHPHR